MISRHSFNIFTARFSLVYKSLLYLIVVTLLVLAIAISAIYPVVSPIIKEVNGTDFFKHIGDAFSSVFSGDNDAQNQAFMQLKADYHSLLEIFANNTRLLVAGGALIFIFFFLYKFIATLCHLPIADVTNHFMMSNSRFGFTSNFILNIKKSLSYSLLHTLVLIPITAVMVGVIYLTVFVMSKISFILMGAVLFLIVVLLLALKRSMFAYWLPTIVVENKSCVAAFKQNFVMLKHSFSYVFGFYFIIYILIGAMSVLFTIGTFGLGVWLVGGMTTVYFKVSDMVIYYRKNRLKYYVDSDTVVNSKNSVSDGYCE